MADNLPRIPINDDWLNLNAASGIPVGTQLKIQNVGGNRVDIAVSALTPTSDIGEVIQQFEWVGVAFGEGNPTWAKSHARNGASELSVQDDS